MPALLESISTAARRAGLELSDVQPDGVVNGDQFDTYKYKLGVTGPYHQIAEFLANVGSLPRIVAPINLTLDADERAPASSSAKKGEQFLDAQVRDPDLRRARRRQAGANRAPSRGRRDASAHRARRVRSCSPSRSASAQDPLTRARSRPRRTRRRRDERAHRAPSSGPTARSRRATPPPRQPRRSRRAATSPSDAAQLDGHRARHRQRRHRRSAADDHARGRTTTRATAAAIRSSRCSRRTSCVRRSSDLRLTGILFDQSADALVATLRDLADQRAVPRARRARRSAACASPRSGRRPWCSRSTNSARRARTLSSSAIPPK